MRLTGWLLVEVALLLIGRTKISLTKSGFKRPSAIALPLRLPPLSYNTVNHWGGTEEGSVVVLLRNGRS
jgi:hypothetical protein